MLILLTIPLVLTALLMLVRFVQPELIYSVRRGLVLIGTNKVFIDKMAGRADVDGLYKQLLVHEARYETRTYDEMFILQDRVVKITELYRLLDPRRRVVKIQKPQVCIVELGALLANLGRSVETNPEHTAPTVKAVALLKYVANGVRASQNEPPFEGDEEIDGWFIENPISIEQVIELLIAAVVALAHRQQAAKTEGWDAKVGEHVEAWPEIRRLEKRLRLLVRGRLQEQYQTEDAIYKRVSDGLGEQTYQECLQRMEKVRKHWPGVALDFFEFVYWGQLETLIFKDWDLFRLIFNEKSWLKTRVELITQVRNEEAHNRHVNEDDKKVVIGYCSEIRRRIDKFSAENA